MSFFGGGILCNEGTAAAAVTPHFYSVPLLIPTFSHPLDARAGDGDGDLLIAGAAK